MISNLTVSGWLCDWLILKLLDLKYTRKSIASNTEVEDEDIEHEETGVWIQSKREAYKQGDLIDFFDEASSNGLWYDWVLVDKQDEVVEE